MSDVEIFYPAVVTLTERDRKLLSESVELPDEAYVFADRYGEQLLGEQRGQTPKPVEGEADGASGWDPVDFDVPTCGHGSPGTLISSSESP